MKHLRKSVEVCMSRIEALESAYSAAGNTYYDPGYPTHSAYFPPSDLSHSDDPQCSSASCTPGTYRHTLHGAISLYHLTKTQK